MAKTVDVKSLISKGRLKRPSNISAPENVGSVNNSPRKAEKVVDSESVPLPQEARARALEAAAVAMEREAGSLRREAAALRSSHRSKKMRERLRNTWREVADMIERGCSEHQAREHVAIRMKVPRETVDYWMDWAERRAKGLAKWRRDREIFRLAHTASNSELGSRFGLSAAQVSRIIHAQLDQVRRVQ